MYLKFVNGFISIGKNYNLRANHIAPINYALERDYPELPEDDIVEKSIPKSNENINVGLIQPSGMEGGRIRKNTPVVRNKKANKFISITL